MSKIRINDLARELEVKSKSILDVLPEIGVTEKKSHSSPLEDFEAERVRERFRAASRLLSGSPRPNRSETDQNKTKIDLSLIQKPGDALKAIIAKQMSGSSLTRSAAPQPPPQPPLQPRLILPQTGPRPVYKAPPSAPPRFVVPTSTPRPTFTVPATPVTPQSTAPTARMFPTRPRPVASPPTVH